MLLREADASTQPCCEFGQVLCASVSPPITLRVYEEKPPFKCSLFVKCNQNVGEGWWKIYVAIGKREAPQLQDRNEPYGVLGEDFDPLHQYYTEFSCRQGRLGLQSLGLPVYQYL